MYPTDVVKPMIAELTAAGFKELNTPDAVEAEMKKQGTMLVVVNSVCGCAARNARPAAIESLQNGKRPERLVTVFAGYDTDATARMRQYMLPFPPSSPSMALFKDGELVHMLERHHIEGRPAEVIAQNLKEAYDQIC